jgi:predicted transcriptional regulator
MGMGVVDDEDLERELKINGNVSNQETEIESHEKERGRGVGTKEVPEGLRRLIAQEYIENGRESGVSLAKSLGISASSASAYAKGATSTASYQKGDSSLRQHTNAVKERIAGKARRRLLQSLHHITPEKLKEAGLKTLSAVSKDMSIIIKNMEPDEIRSEESGTKVNIVIMAPPKMREEDYNVIDVSE